MTRSASFPKMKTGRMANENSGLVRCAVVCVLESMQVRQSCKASSSSLSYLCTSLQPTASLLRLSAAVTANMIAANTSLELRAVQ